MQLAKPWTLPISIMSGLTATYAIPWNFENVDGYLIFTTVMPLLVQAILAGTAAVLAFLGKRYWFGVQIATLVMAVINTFAFSLGIWGVDLPTLPTILLMITTVGLVPVLIWGKKLATPITVSDFQSPKTDTSNW